MSWVRRLPVPYPVLLAAAGIAIGLVPGLPHLHLSAPLLLFGFVPPLVFEAALSFEQENARPVARPIALLATAGVGMTVLGVGAGAHYLLGFSWPAALLLGAIVSPTDPIAVVAVIRQWGAPPAGRPARRREPFQRWHRRRGLRRGGGHHRRRATDGSRLRRPAPCC